MAHVCLAANRTTFSRKLKVAHTTLPTIAGNASTAFPASLLSAFASVSNHFFKTPLSFGVEPPAHLPPPKAPVMTRTIVEIVTEKESVLKIWLFLVHEKGYGFFLLMMYLYQELLHWFAWFLQLLSGGPSNFVTVFLALLVFQYLNHLISLCTTVSVHRYKSDHFLLLLTFWYLFGCAYNALLMLRCYLRVHSVCFVRPC